MTRIKYLEEMCISMAVGLILMAIVFGLVHQAFTGIAETIAFMVATWNIAVYVVWTVIVVIEERRKK